MNSSHLSDERIESYSMGRLEEAEIIAVEEHLLLCAECQEQVAKMDEFVDAVRKAAQRTRNEPAGLWGRAAALLTVHRGPAWAGLAAIAGAILIFIFLPGSPVTPQYLALTTLRGPESAVPHAKANTPINLELDLTGLPASPLYTVELVDHGGAILRDYTNEPGASKVNVLIAEKLPSGQYWIRLYGSSLKTDLLREYGLKVD